VRVGGGPCLALVAAMTAGACVTAQPARVIAPGTTSITVAAARVSAAAVPGDDEERGRWFGQVVVRRGLARRVDAAVVAARTVGNQSSVYAAAVEPRYQVTCPGASRVGASVGLMLGVAGSEFILAAEVNPRRQTRFEGYLVAPTVYVGVDLSAQVELTLAPRAYLLVPARSGADLEPGVGGVVGVRIANRARTWAAHPELGLSYVDGEALLTLGASIAVGD
jgi:hypothetical protein